MRRTSASGWLERFSSRAALVGALALAALAACGRSDGDSGPAQRSGSQAGAGAGGAGGTASGAGTKGAGGASAGNGEVAFDAPCFDDTTLVACHDLFPQEPAPSAFTLAEASAVGEGARFVQLGAWAALATFSDGRAPRLVLAEVDSTVSTFDIDTSDAAGTLQVVAVWGEPTGAISTTLGARAVALGCNDAGCRLLVAGSGDDTLRVVPGYELAASMHAAGLVSDGERLCAYGEGLYCVESGGFTPAISAADSGPIAAVSLTHPAVAATVDGRVLVESESGTWSPAATQVASVREVESYDRTLSLLSSDGTWTIVSLDPPGRAQCAPSPPLLLASPGPSAYGLPWLVVDERGSVVRQRQTFSAPRVPDPDLTWCRAAEGPAGTVRAQAKVPCADGTNVLVITDEAFYSLLGAIACPLT